MVVSHNLTAMNTQRQSNLVGISKRKSTEKLSSGYRINRSADDAAGLAISEKMRRQIRGLTQASQNCQDGISLIQVAEGGLNEVHDILQRMNELSVKAANGTLTPQDREYTNLEYTQLKTEINRVANTTTFNEIQLFPSDGSSVYSANYLIKMNSDGTHTMEMRTDVYSVGSTSFTSNAKKTAEYIAGQIPTILSNLTGKLNNLTGAEDLEISLDCSYIDGGNGTLAYAAYSYYPKGDGTVTPVKSSFLVKVDTADFTDSNYNGDRKDLLDATLRHELTHTLMQYTIPTMPSLPTWFTEGAAQVSGGGFSTGWLSGFMGATSDEDFSNQLKKHTVDGQPYGMGFLATAYAANLANGGGTVTPDGLMAGLNKILGDLKAGKSFSQAISDNTGKTVDEIKNEMNTGATGATAFVKAYTEASKDAGGNFGAGSALLGDFKSGSAIMGSVPADGSTSYELSAATTLFVQAGSEPGQHIDINLFSIGTNSLGLSAANILNVDSASSSIDSVKSAIGVISTIRSYYGATQNRLEHTIKNLDNVVENTTASESKIRDTDMAKEMVELSMQNILEQAGQAMMAQANQSNQSILSLLQ